MNLAEFKRVIVERLQETLGLSPETQAKLWASFLVILVLVLGRVIILRVVHRRTDNVRYRYHVRKISLYVVVLIGIVLVGRLWVKGFDNLTTYLGLLSAGVAIALQDPLANLAGWAFIIWRRPFEVGDRIQIGDHAGDVIDQRIFMFSLMEIRNWVDADQSTGRVIHIPNGKVFREALANFSAGFQYIWDEVPILVTFESDWKKAKQILLRIGDQHALHLGREAEERVKKAAKRFMIFYSKLTPIVYTSVRDCGVLLTVRYLCEPRQRRGTQQAIWESVLEEFARSPDIDFAYPTTRYYDNRTEGKPGAQASDAP